MKRYNFIMLGLIAIFMLGGCAKYKAKPLNRLVTHVPANQEKSTISLAYRVFTQDDCKAYLDRNVIAKGFQPVHITIANNTDRTINFDIQNFSFPCVSAITVGQTVHTNTVGRAVGYGVAGLFLWPFIIPAIVDGIGSAEANDQLDADFNMKSLQSQLIKPFSLINGLIFVPLKDFDPNFKLTLTDIETHERFVLGTQNLWLTI